MSDVGLTGLYVIILLLAFGIFLFLLIELYLKTQSSGNNFPPNSNCSVDTATVPDVSKLQCCVINGVTTSAKFLPIDDLIVAPFPTYYLDVCQGFCQKYDSINKRCLDADQTK